MTGHPVLTGETAANEMHPLDRLTIIAARFSNIIFTKAKDVYCIFFCYCARVRLDGRLNTADEDAL
jgi:hypothetical protein